MCPKVRDPNSTKICRLLGLGFWIVFGNWKPVLGVSPIWGNPALKNTTQNVQRQTSTALCDKEQGQRFFATRKHFFLEGKALKKDHAILLKKRETSSYRKHQNKKHVKENKGIVGVQTWFQIGSYVLASSWLSLPLSDVARMRCVGTLHDKVVSHSWKKLFGKHKNLPGSFSHPGLWPQWQWPDKCGHGCKDIRHWLKHLHILIVS